MSQLTVGDVVRLKSDENGFKMTVASVDNGEIQCIYFNESEQKVVLTMAMPEEVVTSINKPDEDYYR